MLTKSSLEWVALDKKGKPIVPEGVSDPVSPPGAGAAVRATIECWIPATKRPAKPRLHAVLPAFQDIPPVPYPTKHGIAGIQISRVPRLRILLDRPWFSSGEGERLALSGSPSAARAAGSIPQDVLHGKVPRDLSESPKLGDYPMQFDDFTDEDLGPGGRFVTRWGADPIRQSRGPEGPFLDRSALQDLPAPDKDKPATDDAPLYVPYELVPIMDHDEDQNAGTGDGSAKTDASDPQIIQLLGAALLAYVPRFDVESEKWFVDVDFAPGEMVEPFVRLGLVRYQPNAHSALHTSAPVAAWAQVLPERTVNVWIDASPVNADVLHVQVSGPYAGRLGAEPDRLEYPVMQVSVQEMTRTPGGLTAERVLKTIDGTSAFAMVALTTASRDLPPPSMGKAWYRNFTLPKGGRDLAVLVEELEYFMSSDDVAVADVAAAVAAAGAPMLAGMSCGPVAALPANAAAPGKTETSGPKLLARVNIRQPAA